MTSLRLLFDLFITVVVIIVATVPSPRVFHSRRRKRRVDSGLEGLKTHGSAHLALTLL
jgi:hypothetical protein